MIIDFESQAIINGTQTEYYIRLINDHQRSLFILETAKGSQRAAIIDQEFHILQLCLHRFLATLVREQEVTGAPGQLMVKLMITIRKTLW